MGFSKKGERREEKLSLQTSQWQAVNYDRNPRRPRVMHVCGFVNKVMFDRIGGVERTSQGWCNIFRNATKLLHVLGIIGHRLAWPDAQMFPQTNKDFWGAFEMKIHAQRTRLVHSCTNTTRLFRRHDHCVGMGLKWKWRALQNISVVGNPGYVVV